MTAPPFGRWRACALPVLLAGASLLALPARSALANDGAKGMLDNSIHVVKNALTKAAADEQQRAAAAEQLQVALADLEQAVERMDSLKHHSRHPQGGAFDSGVQHLAEYAPSQDTGSPTETADPGASTGSSAGSSGSQQPAVAANGPNKSSTKGSKPSHGTFAKSWHHFRHWWHARHDHYHHDHPFRPGDPGRWMVTAGSGPKAAATSNSTIATASKSPANGQQGLPTGGSATRPQGGNNKTTASTGKATHLPPPPNHLTKHQPGNKTTTSTAKDAHVLRHELVHAAKELAAHHRPPVANHYAVAHRFGGSVGNHPAAVHRPAAPAGRRK